MEPEIKKKGIAGFFESVFGATLYYGSADIHNEECRNFRAISDEFKRVLNKETYPRRLFTINDRAMITEKYSLHPDRTYSVGSVTFMFFLICIIGWLWEVALHFATYGEFANRGMLHGPWLPIYGFGGALILGLLNKFRKKPIAEFTASVVLCGVVEYMTSVVVEKLYDGQHWWDYTGYFMNINARVCIEGLLVFGLGGIAMVYILAPFLDILYKKIKKQILIPILVILITLFWFDIVYSSANPNVGRGVNEEIEESANGMEPVQAEGLININFEKGDCRIC